MANPFKTKKSLVKAREYVSTFEFFGSIYPYELVQPYVDAATDDYRIRLPKAVFVPTPALIRTTVRALVKFGDKEPLDKLFLRFGRLPYCKGVLRNKPGK